MLIPCIRSKIGDWRYYVGSMTFLQVSEYVTPSVKEIYTARYLQEELQRDLTKNADAITNYILKEKQRFFNALVLAVFNGNPQWLEIEFDSEDEKDTNIGYLDFPDDKTIQIFPVDGQHRVKGIIDALEADPKLADEQIPIVFVVHDNNSMQGKTRTRRLFTTLNRRAVPIGDNERIILDEDDAVAYVTREIVENSQLFGDLKIKNSRKKDLRVDDPEFTSMISLYQCNELIVKSLIDKSRSRGVQFKKFKLYRPSQEELDSFYSETKKFWDSFSSSVKSIKDFLAQDLERNFRFEGNVLFRPAAITSFVEAILSIKDKLIEKTTFNSLDAIFEKFSDKMLDMNNFPWLNVIFDGKKMLLSRWPKVLSKLLFVAVYDTQLLTNAEKDRLFSSYKEIVPLYLKSMDDFFAEISSL